MKKLFGTDGVRGTANRHPMTPEMALSLGQAIAHYFSRRKGGGRIVIGKDTRRSSYMFEYALSAGISSMGSQAILTGPLPTPGIAFLITAMRADAGVVISASHNSFEDNGIKFFDHEGFKLPDEVEEQMENFIFTPHDDSIRPMGGDIGRAVRIDDAVGRYVEFLKSTFPKKLSLKGMKIVVDCANGAAYQVAPLVLSEMDAEVIPMGVTPNGVNINDQCGALHPQALSEAVKREKAHLGIALDGDADRVILCDEKGQVIDGDAILALCATEMKKENMLTHNTVVGTVMSNMGLEMYLKANGIQLIRTNVGDRQIITSMRDQGYVLGGEPSGHLIFMHLAKTGDGMVGALQVLATMLKNGKTLSELASCMKIFPQKTRNIRVKKQKNLEEVPLVQKEIASVQKELANAGRLVIRYSGTEPLLRVMVEAKDEKKVDQYLDRLTSFIEHHL